eukprot:UN15295
MPEFNTRGRQRDRRTARLRLSAVRGVPSRDRLRELVEVREPHIRRVAEVGAWWLKAETPHVGT